MRRTPATSAQWVGLVTRFEAPGTVNISLPGRDSRRGRYCHQRIRYNEREAADIVCPTPEMWQLLAGQRDWSLQLYERFLAGTWQRLLLGPRGTRDFIRRLLDEAMFAE